MKKESKAWDIVARRGIYFQAFGIYESIAGFYDYGPVGFRIRKNLENLWRSIVVRRTGSLEIDATKVVSEVVLKASGHVATFADFITICDTCKTSYRADKIVEAYYESKGMQKEFDSVKKMNAAALQSALDTLGIKCAACGGIKYSKVEPFNMLFKTQVGPYGRDPAYLRPETPQGIFIDFCHIFKTNSVKLPVGICQIGVVFRNEISPRQQLVRLREITQMDLELFIDPDEDPKDLLEFDMNEILNTKVNFIRRGTDNEEKLTLKELLEKGSIPNKYFASLLFLEDRLLSVAGFDPSTYRFRELNLEELPFYSKGNVDLEVKTSYGYIELAGNAYRTDYDLSSHAKMSGKDLSVINNEKKIVPHIVEASMGLDRLVFSLLDNSVVEDKERGWDWLKLKESVAPYKYGIFPLQKDDKLIEKAKTLYRSMLEKNIDCFYSETASIGKRYARADEIGVPYAITIDYQTMEDNTVTVRSIKDASQLRKPINELLVA